MLNEETNYTILSEEWRMTLRQVLRKGFLKGCTGLIRLRLGFRDASVQKKKKLDPRNGDVPFENICDYSLESRKL